MGRELERTRSDPGAFHLDVGQEVLNQLADARAAVDMRNDLEQVVRGFQGSANRSHICLPILVAHGPGRDADSPIVEGPDEGVGLDAKRWFGQLLGKAPELAAARDRSLVV